MSGCQNSHGSAFEGYVQKMGQLANSCTLTLPETAPWNILFSFLTSLLTTKYSFLRIESSKPKPLLSTTYNSYYTDNGVQDPRKNPPNRAKWPKLRFTRAPWEKDELLDIKERVMWVSSSEREIDLITSPKDFETIISCVIHIPCNTRVPDTEGNVVLSASEGIGSRSSRGTRRT